MVKQPRGCRDDVVPRLLVLTGEQVFPVILDLNVEVVRTFLPSIIHWDVYMLAVGPSVGGCECFAVVATTQEFNVEVFHIGLAAWDVWCDEGAEGVIDFA